MLKRTPFSLFGISTIEAFFKSEGEPELLQTGQSLGTYKLLYTIFQVNSDTRAVVIRTNAYDTCFYDQSTASGDIDIDSILERAESEHTRLISEGILPEKPEKPRRKQIRLPVGEYHEITTPHQKHRYVFYSAQLPICGTNTEPYKIVSWSKWKNTGNKEGDTLIKYGIGLPTRDEIGMVAWLCCKDEKPAEYDNTLVVFEDGSANLILSEDNRLSFPPRSYAVSDSQRFRFRYPEENIPTGDNRK